MRVYITILSLYLGIKHFLPEFQVAINFFLFQDGNKLSYFIITFPTTEKM